VKRLLVGAIGTLGIASAVVGCSSGGHTASPASSTAPSVATGSGAQIKVGGTDFTRTAAESRAQAETHRFGGLHVRRIQHYVYQSHTSPGGIRV